MQYSYRLKDAQRQDLLEKALPYFKESFMAACKAQWDDDSSCIHAELYGDDDGWIVRVAKKDIVASPAYDPDDWNAYPNVKPPEDVQMRVEWPDEEGDLRHCCAIYRGGRWCLVDSKWTYIDHVLRFRSWED